MIGGASFRPTPIGQPYPIARPMPIAQPYPIAQPITIATAAPIQQQRPIVYPIPQQSQPSCTITVSNYSVYGGGYGSHPVTLSWSSSNATYATISTLGQVALSGSRIIYPTGTQTYVMTVTGPGGTNTCQTTVQYIPQPIPTPTPVPQPHPTPTPSQLSCVLTVNPTTIANGQAATLSWTSYGAVSASLNDGLGNVYPSGSLTVRPEATRTYVLTVRNAMGQVANCTAVLSVIGGNAPYVALSQIPYTGFDFGVVGNSLYWLAILAFAAAAAYLVLYHRGGAGVLMSTAGFVPARSSRPVAQKVAPIAQTAASVVPAAVTAPAPVVAVERVALPVFEAKKVTTDSMVIKESGDGSLPRIVINRS
jgi:hypothetical protein